MRTDSTAAFVPPFARRPAAAALALACAASLVQAAVDADATAAFAEEPPQTVVVTATRHAMLALDAPASLTVVTRRQIEDRGAGTVLDAIRGETGLSLQGRAIGGRQVISLRGLDSKHTLFLVDGRRIGASDGVIGHSDFQYDWVAADDIERIEIVRGPMSVLYGSEALGGVVNVITREPGDAWRFGATASGRRADGSRGGDGDAQAVRAGGPLTAGLALRAGAARSHVDPIASSIDARVSELEGRDKDDGWAGLVWRPGADQQRIDFEHREGRERRWADARERGGARRYHVTTNRIERSATSLAWESQWAGAASPATQLRAYRTVIDVTNERTAGVAVNVPQRLDDRVLDGQLRLGLGAHAWTGGFEARNEGLADPGLPNGRSVAQHRALFLQDEWTLLARQLTLTLGLRHDRHSLYGGEWSPRAYAVWHLGDGWTIKGGTSHGFKAPNLKQIVPGGRTEGPNVFLGNPALTPETSDGVEIGGGWQRGGTEAQLVLFDQRVHDLIDVKLVKAGPAPGTGTYTYENVSRARLRGAEASWSQRFAFGLSVLASYTMLQATQADGTRLDRRPRHAASLRLDQTLGAWRAGLRMEHSRDQRMPSATAGAPSVAVPEVTMIGAQVVRTLPAGLALTLGVDNLTDVRLSEKSPLFQQAEPPRTWRLALRGLW
ncbi:MAG: TonB-dependent receptor [Rubrivivax sp.]|nr:TonB-dependent receptor [Rubrivivax sp.]